MTTTSPEKPKHYISFKYLKNVTLCIPNGVMAPIPASTKMVTTSIPNRSKRGEYWQAQTSVFDLEKEHLVPLKDEGIYVDADFESLTPAMRQHTEQEAIKTSLANKKENAKVRDYLHSLAQSSFSDLGDGRTVEIPPSIMILQDSEAKPQVQLETHKHE